MYAEPTYISVFNIGSVFGLLKFGDIFVTRNIPQEPNSCFNPLAWGKTVPLYLVAVSENLWTMLSEDSL